MTGSSSVRARGEKAAYWVSTVLVTTELGLGGMWDVLRLPQVRGPVDHLGYPSYFLVILGTWKLLGMAALLAPRLPLLKEWAYAGVVFADTGAIASHLVAGYGFGELAVLVPLLALTVLSWSSRPASRRVSQLASTARRSAVGEPGSAV
jgi:DoxX-like family